MATDLAARHSTPDTDITADMAGAMVDMAGEATMVDGAADAGAAASDGASDLDGESGSAGADSGIRSGGDRAGA